MYIIFDTETTGLPRDYNAPVTDSDNWPRLVQLSWQTHDRYGELLDVKNFIIKPDGFEIPYGSTKIHGITNEMAHKEGVELSKVLHTFNEAIHQAEFIVGHNIQFDVNIMGAEYYRQSIETTIMTKSTLDTMKSATDYCKLPGGKGGGYKMPRLSELHFVLFDKYFDEAHNASADVNATARCFFELIRIGVISSQEIRYTQEQIIDFRKRNPDTFQPADITITEQVGKHQSSLEDIKHNVDIDASVQDIPFSHLHVHSQYSILDSTANINDLLDKAAKDHMQAIALTDHGNMYGVKSFFNAANSINKKVKEAKETDIQTLENDLSELKIQLSKTDGKDDKEAVKKDIEKVEKKIKETQKYSAYETIKPIFGSEMYMAARSMHDKEGKIDSKSYHLVLLAKNETGYKNLTLLSSRSFLDGFYYYPRIDKELLKQHSEGLIALSACLSGEVPRTIINYGEEKALEVAKAYQDIFGEDFYLEMQRHPSEDARKADLIKDQNYVNQALERIGEKLGIKTVVTNDVHYIEKSDAKAHDRLICIKNNKYVDEENRMRYSGQEWLKTQQEMRTLFADKPEALKNISEIVDKIETYDLNRKDAIMPEFDIPEGFKDAAEYLRHVTYEGAKERWGESLSDEVIERLEFELNTVIRMKFPGYFLIVWDFLKAARELGVWVGPGRGSAAGSAVAYCLHITEIDPIKYDLLFERFLNPNRISMPDIDIDFDDDGRARILEWVVEKYGKEKVAQIITFGSMAAKSAVRDVARVQRMPLEEANKLAKMIPDKPGTTLAKAFKENDTLNQLYLSGPEETRNVLEYAKSLEGSIRNTGTHACGVIIGRDNLETIAPITSTKASELSNVTQYEGAHVEDVGLLKMDFLGLKTLSIIKDAVEIIKKARGIDVDIHNVDLNDKATYELYSRGETTGLFQFESDGMKKYLRELKPSRFEDLIAMNALYRPGPMDNIPSFIRRKHGEEQITYDLPEMEEILKETYGITVYQEQVMLLSRKLANFSQGDSDNLRKAMGKKIKSMMVSLKEQFFNGCKANNHDLKVVEKIWDAWELFASYAFNKSHATCYSYVSFQTAYLKAHYPAEFMAAVLSRNMKPIEKITFFIEECRHMGINVLGPDINESYSGFTVNQKGEIRFGLSAIKGLGGAAVEELVQEREKNGNYMDILDVVKRVNFKNINKKGFEVIAQSGGFDSFEDVDRSQYFHEENGSIFLHKLIQYGQRYQEEQRSSQLSIFNDVSIQSNSHIEFPKVEKWGIMKKLKMEKEIIGVYISGHPLDDYLFEIKHFSNTKIDKLNGDLQRLEGGNIYVAGIISTPSPSNLLSKKNKPYGRFTIEDISGAKDFFVFDDIHSRNKSYIETEGTPLLLRLNVSKNRYNDEYRLNISEMFFLGDVVEKLAKKITFHIDINEISPQFIEDFTADIKKYPGNGMLILKIFSATDHMNVEFSSLNIFVDIKQVALHISNVYKLKYSIN